MTEMDLIAQNIADARRMFLDMGFDENEAAEASVKAEAIRIIRDGMKERGLTQTKLAELTGVPQPHISAFLSGRDEEFGIGRINQILRVFELEIAERRQYSLHDMAQPDPAPAPTRRAA